MSFASLLVDMARIRLTRAASGNPSVPERCPAPLNLSQNCVVELSPVPYILAQAAGSRMEAVDEKQIVSAVGRLSIVGQDVIRSYLDDGKSFIQTVTDAKAPHGVAECRLYTGYMEDTPADAAAWAFFLADEDGYIGYPMFDIKDGTRFWRSWSPGETRIAPLTAEERITDADGQAIKVSHRLMQYGRRLGDEADAPSEYLLVSAVETANAATFNAWLGIDIDPALLKSIG